MRVPMLGAGKRWASRRTSSRRLIAAFLILALGSLFGLAWLTTAIASDVVSQQATDRLHGAGVQTGTFLTHTVEAARRDVAAAAHNAALDGAGAGALDAATHVAAQAQLDALRGQPDVSATLLLSSGGDILMRSGNGVLGSNDSAWFSSVRSSHKDTLAVVNHDGTPTLVIATPTTSAPDSATLAAYYQFTTTQQSLDDFASAQDLVMSVVTGDDLVLVSHGAVPGPDSSQYITSTSAVTGLGWTVRAAIPRDRVFGGVDDLRDAVVVVTAALAVLVICGATLLNRTLRRKDDAEAQLAHQAFHDGLTGLPNRVLFMDRLERAMAMARRQRTSLAVMILDLNDFKSLNDRLGHHCGDLALIECARRLRAAVRESDSAARLGGDEFVVVAPEVDRFGAALLAGRIRAALAEPMELDGVSHAGGCSLGMAIFPDHGDTAEELLRKADIFMYANKRAQRAGGPPSGDDPPPPQATVPPEPPIPDRARPVSIGPDPVARP